MHTACHPDRMANHEKHKQALVERFAFAVRDARETSGLSQAELAEKIGASLDHVSKLEREKYLPGLAVAAELIRVLELDANALLLAEPRLRKVTRKRMDMEAEGIRLIAALDDKMLETAVELIGVLAAKAGRSRK